MKEIKRSEIEKQVKKEYKEGRDWCRHDWGRYCRMMIDTDDAGIWVDVFLDVNSWKEYHSDTIHQLTTVLGYVKDREEGYIDNAVELLTAAGWTITE